MGLRKSVVAVLARLLGISIVELAADRDVAGEQLAEAAASAADEETLLDVVGDHVDDRALFDRLETEVVFALAGERFREEHPVTEHRRDFLEDFAEELELDVDDVFWKPVDQISEIPDRPEDTYVWILRDDVDPAGFADQIDSMYREHFGRPTRGLHVPVNGVEEIRLADPGEIRTYVEPHIRRAEEQLYAGDEVVDPATASSSGGD